MATALISPGTLTSVAKPRARRGTFYVQTWGCQMNEDDSEQMRLRLAGIGFEPSDSIQEACVILLNTCSVRKKPEDKAFSLLGELALLKERRLEIVVGVCGCMAQLRAEEIRKRAPHVDFVVGTGQLDSIPGLVEETLQLRRFRTRLGLPERKGAVVAEVPARLLLATVEPNVSEGPHESNWPKKSFAGPKESLRGPKKSFAEDNLSLADDNLSLAEDNLPLVEDKLSLVGDRRPSFADLRPSTFGLPKLKAFVPIQYGCDKFCTFCIVPTTRGRERSRPTGDILTEVRALAGLGTKEVTLLGQTVNSYGKNLAEGRVPFSKLLWLLAGIPGLERIRYTSPYPRDFTPDLIACIRDNPKVMEHVHLPLQSGDDEVLKAMKRVYSVEGFLAIVAALREAVPGISLTTDVIVGFPGEDEEQFRRTLEVVGKVRFDGAFMFAYSPRPGTPAAEMPQVPADAKKRRLSELIALQNGITEESNRAQVGRVHEVLVEGLSPKNPKMLQGYSREFRMVHFEGPKELRGRIVPVLAEEPHLWGLRGRRED